MTAKWVCKLFIILIITASQMLMISKVNQTVGISLRGNSVYYISILSIECNNTSTTDPFTLLVIIVYVSFQCLLSHKGGTYNAASLAFSPSHLFFFFWGYWKRFSSSQLGQGCDPKAASSLVLYHMKKPEKVIRGTSCAPGYRPSIWAIQVPRGCELQVYPSIFCTFVQFKLRFNH